MDATKGNGLTADNSQPVEKQTQSSNDLDFPTGQRQRKELIALLQQLAMRGHLVIKGPQNDFHVCKYGYAQYCQDMGELQTFAVKLGVIHG